MSSPAQRARSALATAHRRKDSTPEDITAAQAALEAAKAETAALRVGEQIESWLATWQPTPEQIRAVTAILNPDAATR